MTANPDILTRGIIAISITVAVVVVVVVLAGLSLLPLLCWSNWRRFCRNDESSAAGALLAVTRQQAVDEYVDSILEQAKQEPYHPFYDYADILVQFGWVSSGVPIDCWANYCIVVVVVTFVSSALCGRLFHCVRCSTMYSKWDHQRSSWRMYHHDQYHVRREVSVCSTSASSLSTSSAFSSTWHLHVSVLVRWSGSYLFQYGKARWHTTDKNAWIRWYQTLWTWAHQRDFLCFLWWSILRLLSCT